MYFPSALDIATGNAGLAHKDTTNAGQTRGGYPSTAYINPLGSIKWCGVRIGANRVTTVYGTKRSYEIHYAVDVAIKQGSPIYAIRSGTVCISTIGSGRGGYLHIVSDAGGGYTVQHLSKRLVNKGDHVEAGQLIAYSGGAVGTVGAGTSTGAHLHLELHTSNSTVPQYNKWSALDRIDPESVEWTNIDGSTVAPINTSVGYSDVSPTVTHHVREGNQWITDYPDDSPHKAVDRYTIVYKAYDSDKSYDISDICSSVTITDSASSGSVQFSATLAINKLDKYFKNFIIRTGDKISMKNKDTKEVIYLGTVIQTSAAERGAVTVTALDNGRLLSQEIIGQYTETPAYDALSSIAYKCGLSQLSAPRFESTYTAVVKSKAGDAIKAILDQIESENGIHYFYRVVGDMLIIKSYSEKAIVPCYRPEDNIATAPCLSNATEYVRDEDATDVRTSIQVIKQDDDGYFDIVYEYGSGYAAQRYGKLNTTVDYTDDDTVSAKVKGLYSLYSMTDPKESYTLSCAGSDRITSGAKIRFYIDNVATDCWVDSVTHNYIPNHTVKMTLSKYHDAPTLTEQEALNPSKREDDDDA